MSATEVVLAVGIIAYVIFRQVRGETLRARRTVLLPAVLTVMGYTDLHLTGGHLQAVDLTCLAVGAAGSALVGCAFGVVMRLEQREGYLWARLPVRGLWLWVALVVWRLAMTGVAHAAHAHVAASSSTLLFSLGLNRLAQALVIVARARTMGVPFAPETGRGAGGGLLSGLLGAGGSTGGGGGGSAGTAAPRPPDPGRYVPPPHHTWENDRPRDDDRSQGYDGSRDYDRSQGYDRPRDYDRGRDNGRSQGYDGPRDYDRPRDDDRAPDDRRGRGLLDGGLLEGGRVGDRIRDRRDRRRGRR